MLLTADKKGEIVGKISDFGVSCKVMFSNQIKGTAVCFLFCDSSFFSSHSKNFSSRLITPFGQLQKFYKEKVMIIKLIFIGIFFFFIHSFILSCFSGFLNFFFFSFFSFFLALE